MCGRYLLSTEDENIEYKEIINKIYERYKNAPPMLLKSGEIFPTDIAPVITAENSKQAAALLKWGFPKRQGSGVIINARAETALEKISFRGPLANRRCAVPAAGFFEWRHEEGKKVKYLFKNADLSLLYFAGLYGSFAKTYDAFVILTIRANEYVSDYHSRMPLILESKNIDRWLCDTGYALSRLNSPCGAKLYASMV